MTIRRMALQAAIANLTQNQAITVDANGLLISAGLLTYAYIQTVSATDKLLGRASAGAGVIEEIACTAAGRALIDDVDAAAQRTTLGLGTIATQEASSVSITGGSITGGSITGITDLAVADGGTGSSTAAAARLAIGLVDANDRLPAAMMPSRELSHYFHANWDEKTVVAGTWNQNVMAGQTDYDPALSGVAGYINNYSFGNLDEIHFGSLSLMAGTYKVILGFEKNSARGIIEVLHGTTSLGTVDSYAAAQTFNNVAVFTYAPTTYVTGNLRLRCNGKNASSGYYSINVSKLEIIRTA